MICVDCGKKASKGSCKHPYCVKCFKKKFNNDYNEYLVWMQNNHIW